MLYDSIYILFGFLFCRHHSAWVALSSWSLGLGSSNILPTAAWILCSFFIRSAADFVWHPSILGHLCIVRLFRPFYMVMVILLALIAFVIGEYRSMWLPSVLSDLFVLSVWIGMVSIPHKWFRYLTFATSSSLLFRFSNVLWYWKNGFFYTLSLCFIRFSVFCKMLLMLILWIQYLFSLIHLYLCLAFKFTVIVINMTK